LPVNLVKTLPDLKGLLARTVNQVFVVVTASVAKQDVVVLKASLENKVLVENKVPEVKTVLTDNQVRKDHKDFLAFKVNKDLLVIKVQKDVKDSADKQVKMVLPVKLVKKVLVQNSPLSDTTSLNNSKETLDSKEIVVKKVIKVCQVQSVQKEKQVQLELAEILVSVVHLALRVLVVKPDPKVQKVDKVHAEKWDQKGVIKVTKVFLVYLVSEEKKVNLVGKVSSEVLVLRVLRETKADKDVTEDLDAKESKVQKEKLVKLVKTDFLVTMAFLVQKV